MSTHRLIPGVVLGAALLALGPVPAAEFGIYGDGSSTNNPDLLRGGIDCENCAAAPLREDVHPPFDIDWSLALRGSFVEGTSGTRYEASVAPSVAFTTSGPRTSLSVTADGEVVRSNIEPWRIAALRVGAAAGYELDSVTVATLAASLALTQDAPDSPGNAANVLESPRVLSGEIEAAVARDFGIAAIIPRVFASRALYGETTVAGPAIEDNTWQSNTVGGAGLRVGKAVSPVFGVFADGDVRYQGFDAPNPSLLVPLDNVEYAVRGGVTARGPLFDAEASLGYGELHYVYGLPPLSAVLYNARATVRPDETVTLSALFSTELSPPGTGGGQGRIGYTARLDAGYVVNPWLALRASADWTRAERVGTTEIETSYGFGVGADYAVSDRAVVSADYAYGHGENPPSAARDSHRVTLGVTFTD